MSAAGLAEEEVVPGARPADPEIPPAPRLWALFAEGIAAALGDMRGSVEPDFVPDKGSWVREARIGSRRLRTVMKVLGEPGDPRGLKPLRDRMGLFQDELSGSRDLEVVLKWLNRQDADWAEVTLDEREALAELLGGGAAPEASVPPAADYRERVRGFAAACEAILLDAVPEELRYAGLRAPAEPAPPPGEGEPPPPPPEEPGLPRPRALRLPLLDPGMLAQIGAVLTLFDTRVRARQGALLTDDPDADELHDLRREARKLRYVLEALLGNLPALGKVRKAVKRFQWLLGQVQDRHVVAAHVEALELPAALASLPARLGPLLAQEIHLLLEEAREILGDGIHPRAFEKALQKATRG